MRNTMMLALGLALAAPALAQTGHIDARQAIMKQNGRDTKAGGDMLKGATPFDAAKAQTILDNYASGAKAFGTHFPKGSETGGDTEASPAIWSKPADWKAALAKWQKDTGAAAASKPTTIAAFGAAFGQVTQNCKSCHEGFRVKKD